MTSPTMRIDELFRHDVTRDIPPVVYFHEQSPEKLADEVREYIITGGYLDGDPRLLRVPDGGIHEQLVRLLDALHRERTRPGGPDLPASWISGFYGSGKSSFAKLVGLALDGRQLPDGTPLAAALIGRDDSPRAADLRAAWERLVKDIRPMAVAFDIGTAARDNEQIHSAVVREVQKRLGYCPTSELVAEEELKLERDEEWDEFLRCAQKALGAPWEEMKRKDQADDHFSHALHVMRPERYRTPTEWILTHARRRGKGLPVEESVELIESMLDIRDPERTLFLVVDEVSQYVHDSQDRMLKLQSFVSALGERLKGRVWLLVTGQQKLEEGTGETVLHKLKDRFPPRLRVHLSPENIRDVVHRRLLAKRPDKEVALEALFQKHRAELKLYGFKCEDISASDFVEIYPMLPGHIDLVLEMTTKLRLRSSRMQGDSSAIRGLLQLLGEVFRRRDLAGQPIGALLDILDIYEVLHTALDSDVQATLNHVFSHCAGASDAVGTEVAKAVAMLELVQEKEGLATKPELVTQCLYRRLGQPNRLEEISAALERLRAAGLLSLTEKHGYRIQSSSGQEWTKERGDFGVGSERISELVRKALEEVLAEVDRPRLGARAFGIATLYSDRHAEDQLVGKRTANDAVVTLDLRFATNHDDRSSADWGPRSAAEALRDRIVWVVGDLGRLEDLARTLSRCDRMVERYGARRESLTEEKRRLLSEEEALRDEHRTQLRGAVAHAFHGGTVYFRGQPLSPRDRGGSFATALHQVAESLLPALYPSFTDFAVTETELFQLLARDLHGPSEKFFEKGLGILGRDDGRIEPRCAGAVPQSVLSVVQKETGTSGERLFKLFLAPPYGYAPDVVKACIAGLLRAAKIKILPEGGSEITAVRDPGVEDLFRKDRDFKRAEIFPHVEPVTGKDRASICKLLEHMLKVTIERDNDHIADVVHAHFGRERDKLRELERRFERLPKRPELPDALSKFGKALEACRTSRHVEPTVLAVKTHLDALRDGFEQRAVLLADLSEAAIDALRDGRSAFDHQLAQLTAIDAAEDLADVTRSLTQRFASERPWKDVGDMPPAVKRIRETYVAKRRDILGEHETQTEAARARVKARPGFEKLGPDPMHAVLRPFSAATFETTESAVAPDLATLAHTFSGRLARAEELANDLFDRELERLAGEGKDVQFVRVGLELRGRELATEPQLDAMLKEIDDQVRPQLKAQRRVRLT